MYTWGQVSTLYMFSCSLGPRPSHPLLKWKIGKTWGGGGSGQVGTEKFVFRGISEAWIWLVDWQIMTFGMFIPTQIPIVRTRVKKSICPTWSGVEKKSKPQSQQHLAEWSTYSEVRTARSRERVCERPGRVCVSSDGQWKVALLWMLASCVRLYVRQCRWKQVNRHRSEPPEGIAAIPSTRFLC